MGAKVRRREKIMSKIDEVRAEMVAAMKNKDKERKDTLSMLLAALKNKAIDKREDLTEAEENEVIKKEIKQTQETKDLAPADRADIVAVSYTHLDVYKRQCAYKVGSRLLLQSLISGFGECARLNGSRGCQNAYQA